MSEDVGIEPVNVTFARLRSMYFGEIGEIGPWFSTIFFIVDSLYNYTYMICEASSV